MFLTAATLLPLLPTLFDETFHKKIIKISSKYTPQTNSDIQKHFHSWTRKTSLINRVAMALRSNFIFPGHLLIFFEVSRRLEKQLKARCALSYSRGHHDNKLCTNFSIYFESESSHEVGNSNKFAYSASTEIMKISDELIARYEISWISWTKRSLQAE